MMQDPMPENISGEKVARHSFEHQINWGHVVLGGAAILLLLKFGPPVLGGSSSSESEEESESIIVEEVGESVSWG
jgi:hypothetical protein